MSLYIIATFNDGTKAQGLKLGWDGGSYELYEALKM